MITTTVVFVAALIYAILFYSVGSKHSLQPDA
jgi:hypothetical protein